MNTTNSFPTGLFTHFKQQGYWVKYAAATTLAIGIYMHVTSFLIGRDLFLQHVLTARFDMFIAIPELDFIGTTSNNYPGFFIYLSIVLIAAAFMGRERLLQN